MEATDAVRRLRDRCRDHRPREQDHARCAQAAIAARRLRSTRRYFVASTALGLIWINAKSDNVFDTLKTEKT
jgi:hypothetical protein